MAGVIMICGGLCCGKTTYAEALRRERGGVILSIDALMLALFGPDAGEMHDEYARRAKAYLHRQALLLLEAGVDVILDWGFWRREERTAVRALYEERGFSVELHALDITDETWRRRVAARNAAVQSGATDAYFVDEGLAAKFKARYERPEDGEADIWIKEEKQPCPREII
ncbi:MAG: ATP-binding protein [Clostridia bacterium]|nr:ATP-binding protein [Clostridia bacterium]